MRTWQDDWLWSIRKKEYNKGWLIPESRIVSGIVSGSVARPKTDYEYYSLDRRHPETLEKIKSICAPETGNVDEWVRQVTRNGLMR